MHHIGTRNFYKDVKQKADSLQELGFEIFYESIITPEYLSQDKKTFFKKKHRRLTGASGNLYLDTISNKLLGKIKIPKEHNLINQPPKAQLLDITQAINVDAQLDSLILKFEKLHGNIKLTPCDLQTDIYDPSFNCETLDRNSKKVYVENIVLEYRNTIIAEAVLKSQNNKIVLIYGKGHLDGVQKILADNTD